MDKPKTWILTNGSTITFPEDSSTEPFRSIDEYNMFISLEKGEPMEIYDVVKKLAGEIDPVGETQTDDKRFENLKTLIVLVDKLMYDIDRIAVNYRNSYQFSKKRASEYSIKFLEETMAYLGETIETLRNS